MSDVARPVIASPSLIDRRVAAHTATGRRHAILGVPTDDTGAVEPFLQAVIATAFVAGAAGVVTWVGSQDRETSWYPWPPTSFVRQLLCVAIVAAALAVLTWMFATVG